MSCSWTKIMCCSWNLLRQEDQTWRLNTQPKTIWSKVSGDWSQKMQRLSSWSPWCHLLSAVQHLLCKTNQKKSLTFGGAEVFQMWRAPRGVEHPKNIAPYADAAEYCWDAANLQTKVSGVPGERWTCSSVRHRLMKSVSKLTVRLPVIWCTQLWLFSASATVTPHFRLGTASKTAGAMILMLDPRIQLSVQKRIDSPLPRTAAVAALKKARTSPFSWSGK